MAANWSPWHCSWWGSRPSRRSLRPGKEGAGTRVVERRQNLKGVPRGSLRSLTAFFFFFRLEDVFEKCQTKIPSFETAKPTPPPPAPTLPSTLASRLSVDEPDTCSVSAKKFVGKPRAATNNFVRPLADIQGEDVQQAKREVFKPKQAQAQRCKPNEQIAPSSLLSVRRPLTYNDRHASAAFKKDVKARSLQAKPAQQRQFGADEKDVGGSSPPIDRRSIFVSNHFPLQRQEMAKIHKNPTFKATPSGPIR